MSAPRNTKRPPRKERRRIYLSQIPADAKLMWVGDGIREALVPPFCVAHIKGYSNQKTILVDSAKPRNHVLHAHNCSFNQYRSAILVELCYARYGGVE